MHEQLGYLYLSCLHYVCSFIIYIKKNIAEIPTYFNAHIMD